jgi:hypothetical protein
MNPTPYDNPIVERLKNEAKTLRNRCRKGDESARNRITAQSSIIRVPELEEFPLQKAQWVVARGHGYSS